MKFVLDLVFKECDRNRFRKVDAVSLVPNEAKNVGIAYATARLFNEIRSENNKSKF
ncbi:MAG: hypothetical protein ACI85O_000385 [Saprospiraceae bacterium]|jgi:hypothetical protein